MLPLGIKGKKGSLCFPGLFLTKLNEQPVNMVIFSVILLALTLLLSFVHAADPVVDLQYSKYRGKELGNGVTQWLGMRYASPPLKDLRFKPPKDPLSTRTVQDAGDVSPFPTS